jgi:hypothetical protein
MDFTVKKKAKLTIGYTGENEATIVHFLGFDTLIDSSIVYLSIELDNPISVPLTDMSLKIEGFMTQETGTFNAQLVEVGTGDNEKLVHKSPVFRVVIQESVTFNEDTEIDSPTLDLEYAKLRALYNEIQEKLANGELVGEKGEQGERGFSNYELAVQNGFEGTEEEYLKSLEYTHSEEYQTLSNKMDNTYDKSVKVSSEFDDKAEKFNADYVSKVNDFNTLNDDLTKDFNDNYDSKKASVDEVKDEVDKAKEDIQDSIDDVAQEATAQDILDKFNELNEMVRTISENSQNADSLNGFGFELLDDGSVMLTYTEEETEEQTGVILPTETTLQKVLNATGGIRDSVLEIATSEEE